MQTHTDYNPFAAFEKTDRHEVTYDILNNMVKILREFIATNNKQYAELKAEFESLNKRLDTFIGDNRMRISRDNGERF